MTILVSSEVSEEIVEAIYLVREYSMDLPIVLHAPAAVLKAIPTSTLVDEYLRVVPARFHAHRSRPIAKLAGLLEFLALAVRTNPTAILSGFSLLKHRLASTLLRRPHVAYIRGLMFNPATKNGFSDRVRYRLFRGRNLPIFNAYSATHVLTVADVNRQFIIARGVEPSRIHLVGPVWLRNVPPAADAGANRRVFFVTQAFEAHGAADAHALQTAAASQLANEMRAAGIPLSLRVHPRDYFQYETDDRFDGVDLDRTPSQAFIAQLTLADVLISPLSTLAFEALYLGVETYFYTAAGVTDRANSGFSPGVPTYTISEVVPAILHKDAGPEVPEVFSPIAVEVAVNVIGQVQ